MVRVLAADPRCAARTARAWQVLAGVSDPEIPVISVVDLGLVRAVVETDDGVEVHVTPTYAGCPATHVIEADITAALGAAGIAARVVTTLSPAWTTACPATIASSHTAAKRASFARCPITVAWQNPAASAA